MTHSNQAQGPVSITWWVNFAVESKSIKYDYHWSQIYIEPDVDRNLLSERPRNRRNDYRQVDHEEIEPKNPIPVGPGQIKIADGSVELLHSGYELNHVLHVPLDGSVTPNQQQGDKENLRIEATVHSLANCERNLVHTFGPNDDSLIYEARNDGPGRNKKISDFGYYSYLNPILYIQQPNGGFLLFSELISANGWCRILFSAMQHIPDQHKPVVVGKHFPEEQITVISMPYRASDEFRKLEVKQDGDANSPAIYLEFRARNRSVGRFLLDYPQFAFIANGDSHIGIGYWPRVDREALYFHGDIKSVECDPHGLCPCPG